MAKKNGAQSPPYISFDTWQRLMGNFQNKDLPDRIDGSYLQSLKLSGSTRSMFRTSLLFLGLLDDNDHPTEELKRLSGAEGKERQEILRQMLLSAYPSIGAKVDLARATPDQLKEYFHKDLGVTGDIARKCHSFLLGLAVEAGITIPSYLRSGSTAPRKRARKTSEEKALQLPMLPSPSPSHRDSSWWEPLLAKFPSLELTWSDVVKEKWLADFKSLAEILASLPRA